MSLFEQKLVGIRQCQTEVVKNAPWIGALEETLLQKREKQKQRDY